MYRIERPIKGAGRPSAFLLAGLGVRALLMARRVGTRARTAARSGLRGANCYPARTAARPVDMTAAVLFHRDAFRQIARFVHVAATKRGDVIGEQLQRNDPYDRL